MPKKIPPYHLHVGAGINPSDWARFFSHCFGAISLDDRSGIWIGGSADLILVEGQYIPLSAMAFPSESAATSIFTSILWP